MAGENVGLKDYCWSCILPRWSSTSTRPTIISWSENKEESDVLGIPFHTAFNRRFHVDINTHTGINLRFHIDTNLHTAINLRFHVDN